MASGAAAAFNCLIEQEIDARMVRTVSRPLPSGRVSPVETIFFASIIGVIGLSLLYFYVNPLTMWLTFATFLGYAVIYTIFLKPATPLNIVIGGASGAMPPILGWTAVNNVVSPESLILFLIIFAWTPPHFWALAIKYRDDYAAAGIPMLPVVATKEEVAKQSWFHTIAMIITSLLTLYSAGFPIWSYVLTFLMGISFAWQLRDMEGNSGKIFNGSISYLSLYSILLVVGTFF